MPEYFIQANSFAAPFFSDTSYSFVEADDPRSALEKFSKEYSHPAGLFAANAYATADAFHKGEPYLAQWLCNAEIFKQEITHGKSSCSSYSDRPGHFQVDDVWYEIYNPKDGRVV